MSITARTTATVSAIPERIYDKWYVSGINIFSTNSQVLDSAQRAVVQLTLCRNILDRSGNVISVEAHPNGIINSFVIEDINSLAKDRASTGKLLVAQALVALESAVSEYALEIDKL